MVTFYLYDRWDNQIGTVLGVIEARRSWTLNGEHLLTIKTPMTLSKGQRIIYADGRGIFREFIVSEPTESDETGIPITTAVCEDSIAELLGDFLVEKEPNGSAFTCLRSALSNSRWEAGKVDVPGTARMSFYHTSAREAVNAIAEQFGGELSTTITVENGRITSRKVNITTQIGANNQKRFTCRKDLSHIERTVSSEDVCTRLYGYGKSLECTDEEGNATGGFSRKLDFAEVNGGKQYVESEEALALWGRPDGKGGMGHVSGIVEFEDCEDKNELKKLTLEELERRSSPKVAYTASVVTLAAAGLDKNGVSDGDTVTIIDEHFEPTARLQGRVLAMDEDLLEASNTIITLGNIFDAVTDTLVKQQQTLASLKSHATSWDGAASVSQNYINAIVNRLNEEFDAGGSYKYEDFKIGTIYSSVPLDDNFKPTRTPASAIQLSGLGLRIASNTKSNGEFDWRTFGTGEGFTADVINAGTIRGGNSYWNLESGDLFLKDGRIDISGTVSGKPIRTTLSPTEGLRITTNGSLIGGLEVVDGDAHLRAGRCGTTAANYVTTGNTIAGNSGASFVNRDGNYIDIEALQAIDDSSGRSTGVGMACFDKPFFDVSAYYKQVWLWVPTIDQDYLKQPPQQIFLDQNKAYIQLSDSRGLFISNNGITLQHDDTHYIRIDSSGVECRCGSKGFGWYNGKFESNLIWS